MLENYEFDGFSLDAVARTVTFGGTPLKLTAKSIAVLTLLARRAPNVVSRGEFEAAIWPDGYVDPANLTQTIYMLRRAFADRTPDPLIETVNGRGYRLLDVRLAAQPAALPRALETAFVDEREEARDANSIGRAIKSLQTMLHIGKRTTVSIVLGLLAFAISR